MRIASFDIGKKNFAHYVEDVEKETLDFCRQEYLKLPNHEKSRCLGHKSQSLLNILKTLCVYADKVHIGVYDLRHDKQSNDLDIETRKNLIKHLEEYRWLWDTCDIVVLEQQYFNTFSGGRKQKGSGANVDAIKIGESTLMWFLINYPDKNILTFGSQYKTQMLGAPHKMTKHERKKWAIEKSKEILTDRGDEETLEQMFTIKKGKQKLDDVSDCIVQCQAYKYREYIAQF